MLLRSQPALAKLPVVVWSSSALKDDQSKARLLGATDYFVKPGNHAALVKFACELDERWFGKNGQNLGSL